ncbi:MAG: ABC transporter ATP-binding protein [Deltaproteobacteria bacterium]|nr:ABC transporter ATP-binding protein [Deltaproteobacteria bacterium]
MTETAANHASEIALVTEGLTKTYASGFKLGPLHLTVAKGATIGLVGKNGAGKTTTFQLLTGNSDPSAGEVRLLGHKMTPDSAELKRQVGYLPQDPTLPSWATGHEVLTYAAELYGISDPKLAVAQQEELWDCASYRSKPLATLSYGMQKRVGLALATLNRPPLLILDEPFSGLDLSHIKTLERAIAARAEAGLCTILSTHVLSFCAKLCHQVQVLSNGQLTVVEPWHELGATAREAAIERCFFAQGDLS